MAALFAVLIVTLAVAFGYWCRAVDRRLREAEGRMLRENIRPPSSRAGLDLTLQEQSVPFPTAGVRDELYPPGAITEGQRPARPLDPSLLARDVIERGGTLYRLPWLKKGGILDEYA